MYSRMYISQCLVKEVFHKEKVMFVVVFHIHNSSIFRIGRKNGPKSIKCDLGKRMWKTAPESVSIIGLEECCI